MFNDDSMFWKQRVNKERVSKQRFLETWAVGDPGFRQTADYLEYAERHMPLYVDRDPPGQMDPNAPGYMDVMSSSGAMDIASPTQNTSSPALAMALNPDVSYIPAPSGQYAPSPSMVVRNQRPEDLNYSVVEPHLSLPNQVPDEEEDEDDLASRESMLKQREQELELRERELEMRMREQAERERMRDRQRELDEAELLRRIESRRSERSDRSEGEGRPREYDDRGRRISRPGSGLSMRSHSSLSRRSYSRTSPGHSRTPMRTPSQDRPRSRGGMSKENANAVLNRLLEDRVAPIDTRNRYSGGGRPHSGPSRSNSRMGFELPAHASRPHSASASQRNRFTGSRNSTRAQRLRDRAQRSRPGSRGSDRNTLRSNFITVTGTSSRQ